MRVRMMWRVTVETAYASGGELTETFVFPYLWLAKLCRAWILLTKIGWLETIEVNIDRA